MIDTLDALSLILHAPLWPRRSALTPPGHALYDALTHSARPFALAVARGDFHSALTLASAWSPLVNTLIDSTHIATHPASAQLLSVYTYYLDQIADFSQIQHA